MLDCGIVVLVWNQPHLLEYTLEQMEEQTIIPSLVVVDDASCRYHANLQKRAADYYGAKYIYLPSIPKLFRKTLCGSEGLKFIDNEFVGIFDVHGYYESDYLGKLFGVVSRYKNLVVTNHWYWLKERLNEVKYGSTITPCHLDGTKCECNGRCIDWERYCTIDNIFPTPWGWYADGNFFMRREGAERYYDRNLVGAGWFSGDVSWEAIRHGQSIAILGDVHSYHIKHYKYKQQVTGCYRTMGYIRRKRFFWNLPRDNGLIPVEGV